MKRLASYLAVGLSVAMAACTAQAEMEPPASVDQAYAAAHAVSGQPLALERDQTAWREALPATDNADQIADRIATLTALTRSGEKIARARPTVGGLSAACVTDWLDGCRTDAGGYVNTDAARRLYWQRQIGSTVDDGVSAGLILMVEDGAQALRPVAWTFGGRRRPATVSDVCACTLPLKQHRVTPWPSRPFTSSKPTFRAEART